MTGCGWWRWSRRPMSGSQRWRRSDGAPAGMKRPEGWPLQPPLQDPVQYQKRYAQDGDNADDPKHEAAIRIVPQTPRLPRRWGRLGRIAGNRPLSLQLWPSATSACISSQHFRIAWRYIWPDRVPVSTSEIKCLTAAAGGKFRRARGRRSNVKHAGYNRNRRGISVGRVRPCA
jgi:hypothetical protein